MQIKFHGNGSSDKYLNSPNVISIQLDFSSSEFPVISNSISLGFSLQPYELGYFELLLQVFRKLFFVFPESSKWNWGLFNYTIEQTGYGKRKICQNALLLLVVDTWTKKKALLSVSLMLLLAYNRIKERNVEATSGIPDRENISRLASGSRTRVRRVPARFFRGPHLVNWPRARDNPGTFFVWASG